MHSIYREYTIMPFALLLTNNKSNFVELFSPIMILILCKLVLIFHTKLVNGSKTGLQLCKLVLLSRQGNCFATLTIITLLAKPVKYVWNDAYNLILNRLLTTSQCPFTDWNNQFAVPLCVVPSIFCMAPKLRPLMYKKLKCDRHFHHKSYDITCTTAKSPNVNVSNFLWKVWLLIWQTHQMTCKNVT